MKILVLNFRIYSIEYELFEMPKEIEICKGVLNHIGFDDALLTYNFENETKKMGSRADWFHRTQWRDEYVPLFGSSL